MSSGPDAATWLERGLVQAAAKAGLEIMVAEAEWARWASATFTGARHRLKVNAVQSDQLDSWVAALPEHDFGVRGHMVADLAVAATRRAGDMVEIEIEALTVEAR